MIYTCLHTSLDGGWYFPYTNDLVPVVSQTYKRSSLQSTNGQGDHPCEHYKFAWTPPLPSQLIPGRRTMQASWEFKTSPQYRYGVTWYNRFLAAGDHFVSEEWSHQGGPQSLVPYERTFCCHFYPQRRERNLIKGKRILFNRDETYVVQEDTLPSMWGLDNYCYVCEGESVRPPTDKEIDDTFSWHLEKAKSMETSLPPFSEAFRECVNSISAGSNNIANVLEWGELLLAIRNAKITDITKELKELAGGNKKVLKNLVASGWLAKRYAIDTAKSDLSEIATHALSGIDVENLDHFKRYASIGNEFGRTTCRAVFSTGHPINKTLRHLETTGLMLNEYVVWDMIPLSFIVDWFLPIGDFLEDLSQNWVSNNSVFNYHSIICSHKWVYEDSNLGVKIDCYKRRILDNPPPFETYSSDPSTGTIVRRIVDAGALIIGD